MSSEIAGALRESTSRWILPIDQQGADRECARKRRRLGARPLAWLFERTSDQWARASADLPARSQDQDELAPQEPPVARQEEYAEACEMITEIGKVNPHCG